MKKVSHIGIIIPPELAEQAKLFAEGRKFIKTDIKMPTLFGFPVVFGHFAKPFDDMPDHLKVEKK